MIGSFWLSLSFVRQSRLRDNPTRRAFSTLLSGILDFNNMFASYKGEGTGAVRHMFSHHIRSPSERGWKPTFGEREEFRFPVKPLSQPTPRASITENVRRR